MKLNAFTFHKPTTLQEAAALFKSLSGYKLLAGGTFLINNLKNFKSREMKTPGHIISLKGIKELSDISETKDALLLGPMLTIHDLASCDAVSKSFPVIREACAHLATTPIRNMATLGGNLTCRYSWSELPGVMIALAAELVFMDAEGKEERLPAEAFFENQAKTKSLLTKIIIPKMKKGETCCYQRMTKTSALDVPFISLTLKSSLKNQQPTDTVITVNNGQQFARRDKDLESFMNQTVIQDILKSLKSQMNENLYGTGYKKELFLVMIKKALESHG